MNTEIWNLYNEINDSFKNINFNNINNTNNINNIKENNSDKCEIENNSSFKSDSLKDKIEQTKLLK